MFSIREEMKKAYRLVYHMTPIHGLTDPTLKQRSGLVYECNGGLCDVFNRFMADHQFAFQNYIIGIDSFVELEGE